MVKRQRTSQKSSKRPTKKRRTGYQTVARTRGVYATGEMKYFDTGIVATSIVASPGWLATEYDPATILTLVAPTVGAGINQRIGKEIKVMKIKIHGSITRSKIADANSAVDTSHIRLALVQDMQTNSAQVQGEQVYSSVTTSAQIPLTFQNIDNFGRFKVLKDKVYTIGNPNATGTATANDIMGQVVPFKMSIKFKIPVRVRFNATNGGTIADIVDNSFHVICNGSSIDANPQLTYLSRVCYKE